MAPCGRGPGRLPDRQDNRPQVNDARYTGRDMSLFPRERPAARIEAEALRHLARLDPAAVAVAGREAPVAGPHRWRGFDPASASSTPDAARATPGGPASHPAAPPGPRGRDAEEPQGVAREPCRQLLHEACIEAASLGLPEALARARREFRLLLAAGGLVATLTGAGLVTAAGLVTGGGRLNVYAVLIVLLGLNTFGLLAWIGSLVVRPRLATRALAGADAGSAMAEAWLRRLGFGPVGLAARLALLDARLGPALQPWAGAALVHAYWLVALLAAVLVLGLRLMVEQVDFIWETTLLSRTHFEWLTATLGWLPARAGFPVPDGEQIALTAGGLGVPTDHPAAVAARRVWAGWLIGCTLIYGLVPRGLALLTCRLLLRRREGILGLPLAHPFWLHRLQRLERRRAAPATAALRAGPAAEAGPASGPSPPPLGDFTAPAGWVVGLELDTPGVWPPALPAGWSVAGNAQSSAPPAAALPAGTLSDSAGAARLVVLASLVRAPDRGITHWLAEMAAAWPGPVELALTDDERALRRLGEAALLEERASDWARAAQAAGLTHCWWLARPPCSRSTWTS